MKKGLLPATGIHYITTETGLVGSMATRDEPLVNQTNRTRYTTMVRFHKRVFPIHLCTVRQIGIFVKQKAGASEIPRFTVDQLVCALVVLATVRTSHAFTCTIVMA